jgi:hypothetical protein
MLLLFSVLPLQTTDFDMDYFNKSFIPLDVDGNPILSASQQEDLALERDLEAAGFIASEKLSGAGASDPNSPKHVKFPKKDETDPEYEVPLLTVDKGIFRRKVTHTTPGAGAVAADEETGLAAGDGPVSMAPSSDMAGDSNHGDSKKRLSPKPGRFRSTSGDKLHGSSSHSLMSLMGLKSTSDVNKPLLLKNDDNFLEHRKLLVERWKDNIKSKGLDSSIHNSSFHDDREDEVSVSLIFGGVVGGSYFAYFSSSSVLRTAVPDPGRLLTLCFAISFLTGAGARLQHTGRSVPAPRAARQAGRRRGHRGHRGPAVGRRRAGGQDCAQVRHSHAINNAHSCCSGRRSSFQPSS